MSEIYSKGVVDSVAVNTKYYKILFDRVCACLVFFYPIFALLSFCVMAFCSLLFYFFLCARVTTRVYRKFFSIPLYIVCPLPSTITTTRPGIYAVHTVHYRICRGYFYDPTVLLFICLRCCFDAAIDGI